MDAVQLMTTAKELGVFFSLRGDTVVALGHREAIAELSEGIRALKSELANCLRGEVNTGCLRCSSCVYFMQPVGAGFGICGITNNATGKCSRYKEGARITSPLLKSGYIAVDVVEAVHCVGGDVVRWPSEKLTDVTIFANRSGGVSSLVSVVRAHTGNVAIKAVSPSLGGVKWIHHVDDKCLPKDQKRRGYLVTEKIAVCW